MLTKHLFVFYYKDNKSERIFGKGIFNMNWLRKNSFFTTLALFSLFVVAFLILTDEKIEHTETISIEYGESLWSLADQYRGKMAKHEWIQQVEKMNSVDSKFLIAGTSLEIPVMENALYLNELKEQDIVKVAKK